MSNRTKYTMRDVARLAGVSTSTVSAVVNGTVEVSQARKSKVLDAIAALDYQPDAIARSLKTGKSHVIGIVVPDITNAFFPEVIRGAEEAAQKVGYSVLLCDSNEDPKNEERHLAALSARRVDGILLACCAESRAYETMNRRRFPVVYMDRLPLAPVDYTVSTDNVEAGYVTAKHLIQLGHRRIGFAVGNLGLSPHRDRLEGFRRAMQEANLPVSDRYLATGSIQPEEGLAAGRRLLDLKSRPTAIMVSNNRLLLGLLQALDEAHVRVPDDLSLVGFDDYLWNRYFNPSLTALAQQTHEMGKSSFELLLEVMAQTPDHLSTPRHIRLPAELHIRNSTAKPK